MGIDSEFPKNPDAAEQMAGGGKEELEEKAEEEGPVIPKKDLLSMTEEEIREKFPRHAQSFLRYVSFVRGVNALAMSGAEPKADFAKWDTARGFCEKGGFDSRLFLTYIKSLSQEAQALYTKQPGANASNLGRSWRVAPEVLEQLMIARGRGDEIKQNKLAESLTTTEAFEKVDNRLVESDARELFKKLRDKFPQSYIFTRREYGKPFLKPDLVKAIFYEMTINKMPPYEWESAEPMLGSFKNKEAAQKLIGRIAEEHPLWVWHYINKRVDPDEVIVKYSPEFKDELNRQMQNLSNPNE